MTAKFISRLRDYASDKRGELADIVNGAADLIETLEEENNKLKLEALTRIYHDGWMPIEEGLPEVDEEGISDYILLSFDNAPVPAIGLYREDKDGNGAFYSDDDDSPLVTYGIFVNAWMPLPECMRDSDEY